MAITHARSRLERLGRKIRREAAYALGSIRRFLDRPSDAYFNSLHQLGPEALPSFQRVLAGPSRDSIARSAWRSIQLAVCANTDLIEAMAHAGVVFDKLQTSKDEHPLIFFAIKKQWEWVEYLIPLTNPNARNATGQSALMIAASRGAQSAVEALLGAGANISTRDHAGFGALEWAAIGNQSDMFDFLLSRGAKLTTSALVLENLLALVAMTGGHAMAVSLLKMGAPVNGHASFVALRADARWWLDFDTEYAIVRGHASGSTLHWAALHGWSDVIVLLAQTPCGLRHLESNATQYNDLAPHIKPSSAMRSSGPTPLAMAIRTGKIHAASLLIELGADTARALSNFKAESVVEALASTRHIAEAQEWLAKESLSQDQIDRAWWASRGAAIAGLPLPSDPHRLFETRSIIESAIGWPDEAERLSILLGHPLAAAAKHPELLRIAAQVSCDASTIPALLASGCDPMDGGAEAARSLLEAALGNEQHATHPFPQAMAPLAFGALAHAIIGRPRGTAAISAALDKARASRTDFNNMTPADVDAFVELWSSAVAAFELRDALGQAASPISLSNHKQTARL